MMHKRHTRQTGLGAGGAFLVEKMTHWVGRGHQRTIDLATLEDLTREAVRAQGPVAFLLLHDGMSKTAHGMEEWLFTEGCGDFAVVFPTLPRLRSDARRWCEDKARAETVWR